VTRSKISVPASIAALPETADLLGDRRGSDLALDLRGQRQPCRKRIQLAVPDE
jgi:hypothetical protein